MLPKPVGADIVHIQAEPVAGAVHVEVAVGVLLNHGIDAAAQQPQLQQAFHQHAHGGFMHRLSGRSRRNLGDGGLLSRQDQAVKVALLRAEAAIDREGAGDIAVVVVAYRTTRVDQQQVAIVQRGVVGGVVKDAGVIAPGDDRGIGEAAATTGEEVLLQIGAHLRLVLSWLHQGADAFVGFRTDPAGLAQSVQFRRVFAQAHRMQDWAWGRELPHRFTRA